MRVPTKKTGSYYNKIRKCMQRKKKMSTVETHELEWVSAKKDMT